MKKIILATVITLLMLSPVRAADVRFPADSLLVASKQDDRGRNDGRQDRGGKKPGTVIIKGKGGKVTGVEREPDRRPRQKPQR
ncbi:hypothetical protein BerOc1_02656 [Pseudodesulfovibrio hydrargyri]|uniref:Uncharacterized protein n=1 Tax=Pseudodesulfovibrio hydrargyri TaxID=2125990 RepID=A0A1J5N535_9BACT|nr:hypothetical protein [Pseudodesulfovibrio hydrargyri]OIQ50715.1 hypothetical protein BerOc1_02656 [Pseudodesulfovibrio hydrargyri]